MLSSCETILQTDYFIVIKLMCTPVAEDLGSTRQKISASHQLKVNHHKLQKITQSSSYHIKDKEIYSWGLTVFYFFLEYAQVIIK